MSKLTGTSLAGGSVNYKRVDNDFYATNPQSLLDLLEFESFDDGTILEPCCGQGHLSKVLTLNTTSKVYSCDLIDRGYGVGGKDFLTDTFQNYDYVVTNPPYKYAQQFIEKALTISNKKVAMFLKIQFLEGQKRKEFLERNPLKYVYVFSKRQDPWRNGDSINPNTGKKWGSTMCFAWFVWEKGFKGEPTIKWL